MFLPLGHAHAPFFLLVLGLGAHVASRNIMVIVVTTSKKLYIT